MSVIHFREIVHSNEKVCFISAMAKRVSEIAELIAFLGLAIIIVPAVSVAKGIGTVVIAAPLGLMGHVAGTVSRSLLGALAGAVVGIRAGMIVAAIAGGSVASAIDGREGITIGLEMSVGTIIGTIAKAIVEPIAGRVLGMVAGIAVGTALGTVAEKIVGIRRLL